MWSDDFNRIIRTNCTTRHISLEELRRTATRIRSAETFQKKLEDPNLFTILELQGMCLALRLNKEERAIIKKEAGYESEEMQIKQSYL
jgi:hypothetical protein